jgi:hypothetical protein
VIVLAMSVIDPNRGLDVSNLESRLARQLSMPHNRVLLRGKSPDERAREAFQEIIGGFAGTPQVVVFTGPKRFLRGVGPSNRVYSGEWWFEESLLIRVESALSRIPLSEDHRRAATEGQIRSGLALPERWNALSELWVLELPGGEHITGLVGKASEQPILPGGLSRVLSGGETQIYFPVRNPFWPIRLYQTMK